MGRCGKDQPPTPMKTGYLIDMDGVIYRENRLIPGATDFVQALGATGTPFLFLTNNSAPTPEDLAVRLKHLGIHGLSARHFYTSALNTADFLTETDPTCTVLSSAKADCSPPCMSAKSPMTPSARATSWWAKARQAPNGWLRHTNALNAAQDCWPPTRTTGVP